MAADKFDWRHPDYAPVFRRRIEALARIRDEPNQLPLLRAYYREHPARFVNDWGCTVDPRNVERGLPAVVPFLLFERQVECVEYVVRKWRAGEPGLIEKSRDMGVSWLVVSLACTLCLHHPGMAIGFGSRKEEYVDRIGAPKSLFHKARLFMRNLPDEFKGGWSESADAPHMRINFPSTGSNMSGEGGDNIGRGDRTGIYFVDEAAYLEHPELVEASLSQTTNCRIDLSSVNGMGNPFAQKRWGGKIEVFVFDWRHDPRKDEVWYLKQKEELDPVVVAQEVDRDYSASVEGVVIPSGWARSAVDAHLKLGVAVSGDRVAALDVADEGRDKNGLVSGRGILIDRIEEWSGKGGDTFATVERAFAIADEEELDRIRYDSDGIGALVRGDARVINERRRKEQAREIEVEAFRGSEGVVDPEKQDVKGRLNKDYYANRKAQAWWRLRRRFQITHAAVTEGREFDPDEIVSISSGSPLHLKLVSELCQPTYAPNSVGKIVIDKAPEGAPSPNLADACMMRFAQLPRRIVVPRAALENPRLVPNPRLGESERTIPAGRAANPYAAALRNSRLRG